MVRHSAYCLALQPLHAALQLAACLTRQDVTVTAPPLVKEPAQPAAELSGNFAAV
jgi:hypothetical protein